MSPSACQCWAAHAAHAGQRSPSTKSRNVWTGSRQFNSAARSLARRWAAAVRGVPRRRPGAADYDVLF